MTPPSATVALTMPLGLLVAALALVIYSLRGRRVDDHPLCRRCGFDLFGKPDGSTVCAECGADLNRKRATRTGNRERRRRVFGVAMPALLLSVGWLGLLGYGRAKATDWNRHKPVWWLTRAVDGPDPAARDAALTEFARRVGEGHLAPADADAIVEKALAYQADPGRPWVPPWGGVVEAAHAAGRLSEQRWQRYLIQAVTLTLEPAGPVSRRGYPLEFRIRRGPDRVAAAGGLAAIEPPGYFPRLYADRRLFIGDRPFDAELSPARATGPPPDRLRPMAGPVHVTDLGGYPVGAVVARVELRRRGEPPADLADGPQAARVPLVVRAFTRKVEGPWEGMIAQPGERRVDVQTAWTLVPPPRVNPDPSFAPAVKAALTVAVTEYGADRFGGRPRLRYQIACNGMPVNVAYDVHLRYQTSITHEPAGTCFFPKGGRGLLEQLDGEAPYLAYEEPEVVDVIFRPNPGAVPPGVTEIWGGEVVKEVRVTRTSQ